MIVQKVLSLGHVTESQDTADVEDATVDVSSVDSVDCSVRKLAVVSSEIAVEVGSSTSEPTPVVAVKPLEVPDVTVTGFVVPMAD